MTSATITGTVAKDAKPGKSEIKITATNRETFTDSGVVNEDIDVGYNKGGEKVRYNVEAVNGSVTVKGEDTTTGKKGDANFDGEVNMADVASIIQYIGNKDAYSLTDQGIANADTNDDGQVTGEDAYIIQRVLAGEMEL